MTLRHTGGRVLCLKALVAFYMLNGHGPASAQELILELSPQWEYVSDQVMGGVSSGQLQLRKEDDATVAHLTGQVSLENNGGFVQMAFDLAGTQAKGDAASWRGIRFETMGNGQPYDIRLRTTALDRPWQSFRASFTTNPIWTEVQIPFDSFLPHRTSANFDPVELRRVGILAIGRVFDADVSVRRIGFFK